MGLMNFFGQIQTTEKIRKEYGLGAANSYIKANEKLDRDLERQRLEIENQRREEAHIAKLEEDREYEEALKEAIKKFKFDAHNIIRKNREILSDQDIEYLNGIIEQSNYIYDQKSADELTTEWNTFINYCDFRFELNAIIKKMQDKVHETFLGDKENIINTIDERFNQIYEAKDESEYLKQFNKLLDLLKNTYSTNIGEEYKKEVYSKMNEIKSEENS